MTMSWPGCSSSIRREMDPKQLLSLFSRRNSWTGLTSGIDSTTTPDTGDADEQLGKWDWRVGRAVLTVRYIRLLPRKMRIYDKSDGGLNIVHFVYGMTRVLPEPTALEWSGSGPHGWWWS
jgi:hypothetical protein